MNSLLILLVVYVLRDIYIKFSEKVKNYFSEYKEFKEGTHEVQTELVKEKAKSNQLNERLIQLQEAAIAQNVEGKSSHKVKQDEVATHEEKKDATLYQHLVTPKVSATQRTLN